MLEAERAGLAFAPKPDWAGDKILNHSNVHCDTSTELYDMCLSPSSTHVIAATVYRPVIVKLIGNLRGKIEDTVRRMNDIERAVYKLARNSAITQGIGDHWPTLARVRCA